jgi:tetratricopeptide (TPR) repeat protein
MSLPPRPGAANAPVSINAASLLREGQAGLKRGDFAAAADLAQTMLRADPRSAEAWVLLCVALIRMGSADDERALGDALSLIDPRDPAHPVLACERARILAARGRCAEAVSLARLLELHMKLGPGQLDLLSNAYNNSGMYEDARRLADAAVFADVRNPVFGYSRALALRHVGQLVEAEAEFERVIALAPDYAQAHYSLADVRRWTRSTHHIERLQSALRSARANSAPLAHLLFALFKEAHDIADREIAWSALQEGNAIVAAETPYRSDERQRYTAGLLRFFQGGLSAPPQDGPGPIPIFIVGLPRSGTTLVERILSSHPDVTDMGETHGFTLAIRDALGLARSGELDETALGRLGGADWPGIAKRYLESLSHRSLATRFFTEKLPHNYHLVGAMKRAFPQARFVHLRRAPMDSLFGAYKVLFGTGAYTWSYGFEELTLNYRLYRKITDHWRSELGSQFADVTLEVLIADPEPEIRSMLSRIGLPFHEACLTPHEAKGGVSTASSAQVREPINASGVGAWRKYANELEPLRQRLEAEGYVDLNGDPVW